MKIFVKSNFQRRVQKIKAALASNIELDFAENIFNTVREPLLLLDKELKVIKASQPFFDFFKVSSEETFGRVN